jgi:integral membrane protein
MKILGGGIEGALARYKFMAIWSGTFSLLLWFVEVPAHLAFHSKLPIWAAIAIIHGFTYPIYILAAFTYCLKARTSLMTMLFYILAGTLPVASFVAERRAVERYKTLRK